MYLTTYSQDSLLSNSALLTFKGCRMCLVIGSDMAKEIQECMNEYLWQRILRSQIRQSVAEI